MTTATAQDRLRQIAILVSCVDAAAGRQILLHLPTDKARKVREMASQMGPVPPAEKRKILAEFQRSAASSASPDGGRPMATEVSLSGGDGASDGSGVAGKPARFPGEGSNQVKPGTAERHASTVGIAGHNAADLNSANNSWTHLQPAGLVRFLRNERPAVTAVVISQLPPEVAVEVLQHLSPETSREVLLRLSRLQEIDPEAMSAIDEHLSQRLTEYQHHMESELENSRRIQSLLAAAPSAIRQQWSSILAADSDPPSQVANNPSRTSPQPVELPAYAPPAESSPSLDVLDIGNRVSSGRHSDEIDASLQIAPATTPTLGGHDTVGSATNAPRPEGGDAEEEQQNHSHIVPFPHAKRNSGLDAFDRSLSQIEFEQILLLPPTQLANLLSNTDSQLVLLALAGATPQFMKRFMNMLDRPDAKALQSRLQRIGPIRLRDVDEAQRRIVENAIKLRKQQAPLATQDGARRTAA